MPFLCLKNDGTESYRMARAFFIERAHQMACKLVKWEGLEYRYIIGQVFSGLYVTSWLDTVYMVLMVTVVLTAIYTEMKKVRGPYEARMFKDSFIRRLQYGDNSCYAFEVKYLDVLFSGRTKEEPLGKFQRYMMTLAGMELKADETFLFLPDDTGVSPLLTVIKPRVCGEDLVGYDILRQGPEFLKRNFVRMVIDGQVQIMPWRKEDDMFTKSAISATIDDFSPDKWSSKFIGLLIDTMGTNAVAYDAMKYMFLASLQRPTGDENNDIRAFLQRLYDIAAQPGENFKRKVGEQFVKVLARTGLNLKTASLKALSRQKLLREFVWDQEWRESWSRSFNLPLYNLDGTIVPGSYVDYNFFDVDKREFVERQMSEAWTDFDDMH